MIGTPQQVVAQIVNSRITERDAAHDFAASNTVTVIDQFGIFGKQSHAQRQTGSDWSKHSRLESNLPALEVRRPVQYLDSGFRHDLEPDGLPDARGARIPNTVRLERPVLFAARFCKVVRVVFGSHDDLERR